MWTYWIYRNLDVSENGVCPPNNGVICIGPWNLEIFPAFFQTHLCRCVYVCMYVCMYACTGLNSYQFEPLSVDTARPSRRPMPKPPPDFLGVVVGGVGIQRCHRFGKWLEKPFGILGCSNIFSQVQHFSQDFLVGGFNPSEKY